TLDDALLGAGGVDDLAVAGVDRDVAGPGDDVARLGLRLRDPATAVGDLARGARQRDARRLVRVVHQAGAVHAAERGPAPAVRGAHDRTGRVHDGAAAGAARAGGGRRGRGAAGGDAAAVERRAGLRTHHAVDLEALRGLVALDRRVGAGAEDAVDREARAVVVERGLQLLHRAAAGAPAELLRGVEDGRRGDRGGGRGGLRRGGCGGARAGGGGSGRSSLGGA